MNNTIKNVLAICYCTMVGIGLISVITKSFGIIPGKIFFILLMLFTVSIAFVLREEENEIKNN